MSSKLFIFCFNSFLFPSIELVFEFLSIKLFNSFICDKLSLFSFANSLLFKLSSLFISFICLFNLDNLSLSSFKEVISFSNFNLPILFCCFSVSYSKIFTFASLFVLFNCSMAFLFSFNFFFNKIFSSFILTKSSLKLFVKFSYSIFNLLYKSFIFLFSLINAFILLLIILSLFVFGRLVFSFVFLRLLTSLNSLISFKPDGERLVFLLPSVFPL